MTEDNLLPALALALGVITFVELFFRLPVVKYMQTISTNTFKAVRVIRSSRISDHWKEKAIPAYAVKILRASFLIAFYLTVICLVAGAVFSLIGLLSLKNTAALVRFLLSAKTQMGLVAGGVFYTWLRQKIRAKG